MRDTTRLLLSFYGDDFTGSTDALEALARAGVRSALFLDAPGPDQLRGRFAGLKAVGVAGMGRSMSPTQMDEALPMPLNRQDPLVALVYRFNKT